MTIIACVLVVVVPIALIASLMCLKHDIEWSDYRVDILERDILSLKRQLDYQTDKIDELINHLGLEAKIGSEVRIIKKGG
jgi:CII-binding regulator of phage lambda lysogenization HflD